MFEETEKFYQIWVLFLVINRQFNEWFDMRIVRFQISEDSYEVVVTNLDFEEFSPQELKKRYRMHWEIKTLFRDLKYSVGLHNFHSKKVEYIIQEIFTSIIMYNFSKLIMSHIILSLTV